MDTQENVYERLVAHSQDTAHNLAQRHNEVQSRGRPTPAVGDTFIFRNNLDVEWAVVERRPDDERLLVLPLDDFPFVGSRDVELPEKALGGVANVRCGQGAWMDPVAFRGEQRTGILPAEELERVRGRRRDVVENRLKPSVIERDTDDDPEYQRWQESLNDAVAKMKDIRRVGQGRWRPERWRSIVTLAASVVMAIWLAFSLREVQDLRNAVEREQTQTRDITAERDQFAQDLDEARSEREELNAALQSQRQKITETEEQLNATRSENLEQKARIGELSATLNPEAQALQLIELQGRERQRSSRGLPTTIRIAPNAPFFTLMLEVATPDPYFFYRLEIAPKGTKDFVWETNQLEKNGRWISLLLPSGIFKSGTQYEVKFYGLEGEERTLLRERYLLMFER